MLLNPEVEKAIEWHLEMLGRTLRLIDDIKKENDPTLAQNLESLQKMRLRIIQELEDMTKNEKAV